MKNKDNLKTTTLSKLTLKMAAGAIVGAILGASAAVLLSINNGNSFNQTDGLSGYSGKPAKLCLINA